MGFTRNIAHDRSVLGGLINRLGLPGNVLSLLLAHAEAVRAAGARLGLLAPGDLDRVALRHTADSLLFALVRAPLPGERWVDVGSGAGFPGLVLACCFPESGFTLLEPLKRRASFLELTRADLGLANVAVDDRRVESLRGGGFDVAVARALSNPEAALASMIPVVRIGGEAIVAAGPGRAGDPEGQVVRIEVPVDVDSPGVFSMMTREA